MRREKIPIPEEFPYLSYSLLQSNRVSHSQFLPSLQETCTPKLYLRPQDKMVIKDKFHLYSQGVTRASTVSKEPSEGEGSASPPV